MSETQVKLQFKHDVLSCGLAEFIQQQAQKNPPLLSWVELDPLQTNLSNASGRRLDEIPLLRGLPEWLSEMPVIEARLFWQTSSLHVLAEAGGCRWARVEECPNGPETVLVSRYKVRTLADWNRFGFTKKPEIENLQATEYRQQGRLVAWRLALEE